VRFFLCAACAALAACAATPAPKAPGIALVNPGFESTAPGHRNNDPEGWFTFQHAVQPSYRFAIDTSDPHSGQRSLRIDNTGPDVYGAVAQSVEAKPLAGKTARLRGWLRTHEASEGGAVLILSALASGSPLAHNFMADAPVKGTTGWTRYTITLAIPERAERVEIGAMLQGKGSLWLDDVELALE
jgi:hypothetical protein